MKPTNMLTPRAVLLFFAVACLTAATANAADVCPNPNPITKEKDPDHYFSDPGQNTGDKAPYQCDSCQDAANSRDKTCNVYNYLHSAKCLGQSYCEDSSGSFNIYNKPNLRYALEKITSKECHLIVFALDPVIGVEDANHRGSHNFWNYAYYASQKLISEAINPLELGLAINPATRRGQHQLHIHIGRLTGAYKQAIAQLKKDTSFRSVTINGINFRVAYLADDQPGPFGGISPFELVSNALGERFMPREGIIIARSIDQKGWFVLAALDKFVEGELDYTSTRCSMVPPP